MYFHKLQVCRAEEEEDHPELKAKIPDTREEGTLPAEHLHSFCARGVSAICSSALHMQGPPLVVIHTVPESTWCAKTHVAVTQ